MSFLRRTLDGRKSPRTQLCNFSTSYHYLSSSKACVRWWRERGLMGYLRAWHVLGWMRGVMYTWTPTKQDYISGSGGAMVNTWDSPCNDPGSIPGPGGAAWIWVYYPCGSATSSAWDVKQGCRLCTHAFKIMHGR